MELEERTIEQLPERCENCGATLTRAEKQRILDDGASRRAVHDLRRGGQPRSWTTTGEGGRARTEREPPPRRPPPNASSVALARPRTTTTSSAS